MTIRGSKGRRTVSPRAEILGHLGRPTGMPLTWRATDETEDETPDGRTARRVIEFMRERHDKPFFIGGGSTSPISPGLRRAASSISTPSRTWLCPKSRLTTGSISLRPP